MSHIGLGYSREFRKMEHIYRTRNYTTSSTMEPTTDQDNSEALLVHLALFDMYFQTVIAAFCYPDDGSFWTHYLPASVDIIRVNASCFRLLRSGHSPSGLR